MKSIYRQRDTNILQLITKQIILNIALSHGVSNLLQIKIEHQRLNHTMPVFNMSPAVIKMLLRQYVKSVPITCNHLIFTKFIMMPS